VVFGGLIQTANNDDTAAVQYLVEKTGANVNEKNELRALTVLINAAEVGSKRQCQLLELRGRIVELYA